MSGNYFFGQIKKPLVSRPTHIFFRDLSNVFLFVKFAGITCFKICVRNGKYIPQFNQFRPMYKKPFRRIGNHRRAEIQVLQNMGNIHPSAKKEKVRTRN